MTDDQKSFDLIVIGSGPGGYVCAIRAAQLGLKTACVELRKTLGGTCLNVGCIPSKALLESTHHYEQVQKEFASHGIKVEKVSLDLKTMQERKQGIVKSITGGVDFLFKKNKIHWLQGKATLKNENTITLHASNGAKEEYSAKNIVLATGSNPTELPFAKFDHETIIDSTDALALEEVPKTLIIIGGGVIGLEMGSIWGRLGSKITVVEALPHILATGDLEVSKAMLKILKKQGMTFHLEKTVESINVKKKKASVKIKGQEEILEADKVLVAVGRRPASSDLGLEELSIKTERNGSVVVNDHFQTNVPSIYAIGDLIRGPMLAHKAEEEGIALAELIAGKAGHVNYEAVPSVVYTWPELASVGITEEGAKEKGLDYRVGKFNFRANGRSRAMGNVDGFVKIIADKKTDRLMGVHILGPVASELISEIAVAFEYGASAEDLARSVHAHPTLAEAVKEAALDVSKQAIHS